MTVEPGPVDQRALRHAFGHFATGICVVGAITTDGVRLGVTVNSFSSVSLDPPLILVCLARSLRSHDALLACDGFAVSVLRHDQSPESALFASRHADKWAEVDHHAGAAGGLILRDHLAHFDCTTFARVPSGDHTILVGKVAAFGQREGAPLLYYRGRYVTTSGG